MQVLAEVHNVRLFENAPKLKAEVSLILSDPDQMIRLRLFAVHESQGVIAKFQQLQGHAAQVPLEVDIYQGRISYSLAFGGTPKPYKVTGTPKVR